MESIPITTKSAAETKKVGKLLALELARRRDKKAFVVALSGNLGAGKTTFTQGFADALGVRERVLSPTFVLMKTYVLSQKGLSKKHLTHIDCYRIKRAQEIAHLGFRDLLKDNDALILIEWAERIKKLLPKETLWIKFEHSTKPNKRKIRLNYFHETPSSH